MIATATINGPFVPQRTPPGRGTTASTKLQQKHPYRRSPPAQTRRRYIVDAKGTLRARKQKAPPVAMGAIKYNVEQWVDANKTYFLPPICNKMMHSDGQLKVSGNMKGVAVQVFYVGGPNVRPDYHLEEGEELFYMLRGDMLLKVVEHGRAKDVVIREGEVFLLPGRIPHSPQRKADTVGLVIERERTPQELDCMRFYLDEKCQGVLYERWLHCNDLTEGLADLLHEYMGSEERRTGKPGPNSFLRKPAYEPDSRVALDEPFSLDQWINEHRAELDRDGGKRDLFGKGRQSTIVVLGRGVHSTQCPGTETFLWQIAGSASVDVAGATFNLAANDTLLVPAPGRYTLANQLGGRTLATSMAPKSD